MSLLDVKICMNIKNKHNNKVQCKSKATSGEYCAKHSKNPIRFISYKNEVNVIKIQKWWKSISRINNYKRQGPSKNDYVLANNTTELYSFDSFEIIPKIYYYSFFDNQKNIWAFDIRTLSYLISKSKEVKNPYTQEILSEDCIKKIQKRIKWMKKYKYETMYINNEILSVDQIWNQRVLDVFIKMEENNYLVNSDWFHELSNIDQINFYTKLYNIWHHRLQLTIQQKNLIVPGCNNRNKLFKLYPVDLREKDDKYIKKYNLNIIERLISSSNDKTQRSLGIMYVLMALCCVNENVAEAYPWIYASIN